MAKSIIVILWPIEIGNRFKIQQVEFTALFATHPPSKNIRLGWNARSVKNNNTSASPTNLRLDSSIKTIRYNVVLLTSNGIMTSRYFKKTHIMLDDTPN